MKKRRATISISGTARAAAVFVAISGLVSCEKPESARGRSAEIPESRGGRGGDDDVTPFPREASRDVVAGTIEEKPEAGPPEKIALPVDRVLRSKDGRELDATVIGRGSLKLIVVRKADQARFDLAIDDLSAEDQNWARTLAFQAAPVEAKPEADLAGAEEAIPDYISTRIQAIDRLEAKIKRLELESKTSDNDILKRTYRKQIQDARDDIRKMQTDIQLFEARQESGN